MEVSTQNSHCLLLWPMNKTALENKWVEVGDVIASSHRISKFNDFLFSLFHCFFCIIKRNKNSRATATYNYKIKYTRSEAVIIQADVEEIHQFAPFNEITGGNAIVEARYHTYSFNSATQKSEWRSISEINPLLPQPIVCCYLITWNPK